MLLDGVGELNKNDNEKGMNSGNEQEESGIDKTAAGSR